MEAMPLSGPDNTKLEVRENLQFSFNSHTDRCYVVHVFLFGIQFAFAFELSHYLVL